MLLKSEAKQKKPKVIIVDDYKPVEENIILLPKEFQDKPISKPRRSIPTTQKSVKQMVKDYEKKKIILPPPQFRDGYKPVPLPRTKIKYRS